jgi:hypothetical protein
MIHHLMGLRGVWIVLIVQLLTALFVLQSSSGMTWYDTNEQVGDKMVGVVML